MEIQQAIQSLIKKYQLGVKDVYAHKDGERKLVSADGIRRMIYIERIRISKGLLFISPDGKTAVVSCNASKAYKAPSDRSYMALGEVSPENNTFIYPINTAEKRAEARAVLNVLGLYAQGFRGETEIDEYVASAKMIEKIETKSTSAIQETVSQLAAPKTSKKALRLPNTTVADFNPNDTETLKAFTPLSEIGAVKEAILLKPTKGKRLQPTTEPLKVNETPILQATEVIYLDMDSEATAGIHKISVPELNEFEGANFSHIQVLKSAAGYYIGALCKTKIKKKDYWSPHFRDSENYWEKREDAEQALRSGEYDRKF